MSAPRIWLIEPKTKDGLPDFGPSEFVYARFILLRSQIVLDLAGQTVGAVRLPDDLEHFVERVYGTEPLAIPVGWEAELDTCRNALDQEKKSLRNKAKGVMIYRPNDEDLLRQQNAQLDEDNPKAAEKIRAATRDTDPTTHVILVYHIDGQDYLDQAGRDSFAETSKPDIVRIRRFLDNEVTINHRGCVAFYAARPVPSGWRECGMMRHHHVVRIDPFGNSLQRSTLCGLTRRSE